MNLKESFRWQNRIQDLTDEAMRVLDTPSHIVIVESTYLRKKIMAEAEDETIRTRGDSDYAGRITELVGFVVFLQGEREKLSKAIRLAKTGLTLDMDSEISLNRKRQELVATLRAMDRQRSTQTIEPNGGTGYRFNAEGNQVSYRCDVKKVTTIDFDRKVIRRYIKQLDQQINLTSAEIDRSLINSEVDYTPPFDIADSLLLIFEAFVSGDLAAKP